MAGESAGGMTPTVSIIIPIANYHTSIASRAIVSAQAQTVGAVIIAAYDEEGRGAGFARNRGLEQVTTPFVVFLDADDTLEPTFLEKTLAAWSDNHYVYTDWTDGKGVQWSAKPWCQGDWHPITTLLRASDAKTIGFDESLHGGEDSTFYFALTRSGVCPTRVPEALFHYSKEGLRARAWVGTPEHEQWKAFIVARYPDNMGCCGDDNKPPTPTGKAQPGDVWAQAIWEGNTTKRGKMTGRLYPRTGNGKWLWVNKADVDAQPELWREAQIIVGRPQTARPPLAPPPVVERPQPIVANGVGELAKTLWPNAPLVSEPTAEEIEAVPVAETRPNIARVRALAGLLNPTRQTLQTPDGEVLDVIEEPKPIMKPKRRSHKRKG